MRYRVFFEALGEHPDLVVDVTAETGEEACTKAIALAGPESPRFVYVMKLRKDRKDD